MKMSLAACRGRVGVRSVPRLLLGLVLVVLTGLGSALPAQAKYSTVPRATWATNGTVFAIAVHGNTVYLGGEFTKLRNPTTGATRRAVGLAALNRATGRPKWTAIANGAVRSLAVSTNGKKLFAGGDFTRIGGAAARRLVALSPATGRCISSWHASASDTVRDLAVAGPNLYVAGRFNEVKGNTRTGLAKLGANSSDLRAWNPRTEGGRPWAITLSGDRRSVIVGGRFTRLAGAPRAFLGSVFTGSGQVTGWRPARQCRRCYVFGLDSNANSIFAGLGGPGGHLNAYRADSARLRWSKPANGDVQAVAVVGGAVYAGGHFDPYFSGHTRYQLSAVKAATGEVYPYAPKMRTPFPGVMALVARRNALFVGGGFTGVGRAKAQAHFAKFPVR